MAVLTLIVQSTAAFVNELWGYGAPREGVKRMAELAHRHGLPVSWITNGKGAEEMRDLFDRYHREWGDSVTLWTKPAELGPGDPASLPRDEYRIPVTQHRRLFQEGSAEEIAEVLSRERKRVEVALPWSAPLKTAATLHKSNQLIAALEDLGFEALWGFCWEQEDVDGATDCGVPFNAFYASRHSFRCPAQYPGKLVGVHWLSVDLTNSYHSRGTSAFSTDPNDIQRADIFHGRDIGYWKELFRVYRENAAWNEFLYIMFHQEAHEMEYSDACRAYTPEQIEDTAEMLDAFFEWVSGEPGVEVLTMPEAVKRYREVAQGRTLPTYFVSDQIPVDRVDYYYFDYFRRPKPPADARWPRTFFYYDSECQLVFVHNRLDPVSIRDYRAQYPVDGNHVYPEEPLPASQFVRRDYDPDAGRWVFEIVTRACKAVPSGLAIWGDFAGYEFESPMPEGSKVLGDKLVFVKWSAGQGESRLTVSLRKRRSC